jgi:hypothetical protein
LASYAYRTAFDFTVLVVTGEYSTAQTIPLLDPFAETTGFVPGNPKM